MHLDDEIPRDDNLAEAARRALEDIAAGDPAEPSWNGVQRRVRHVQTVRSAILVGAVAMIVAVGGVAVAATAGSSRHRVVVANHPSTTTSTARGEGRTGATTTSTTSVGDSITATTVSRSRTRPSPSNGRTPTSVLGKEDALPAQHTDLEGFLTLGSSTVRVGGGTSYSFTLKNISDHRVQTYDNHLGGPYLTLLISQDGELPTGPGWLPPNVVLPPATLDPGEQRTFTGTLDEVHDTVFNGPAVVSVGLVEPEVHQTLPQTRPGAGRWSENVTVTGAQFPLYVDNTLDGPAGSSPHVTLHFGQVLRVHVDSSMWHWPADESADVPVILPQPECAQACGLAQRNFWTYSVGGTSVHTIPASCNPTTTTCAEGPGLTVDVVR